MSCFPEVEDIGEHEEEDHRVDTHHGVRLAQEDAEAAPPVLVRLSPTQLEYQTVDRVDKQGDAGEEEEEVEGDDERLDVGRRRTDECSAGVVIHVPAHVVVSEQLDVRVLDRSGSGDYLGRKGGRGDRKDGEESEGERERGESWGRRE